MSVSTYNPSKTIDLETVPVSFTNTAIEHLTKQVAFKKAKGIAFKVKESGCSGFKYLLELAFDIEDDAVHYPLKDNLDLYIQPKIIPLINGTEIDYTQEGVNFQLVFNNPNATALCGCGESFSVEPQ